MIPSDKYNTTKYKIHTHSYRNTYYTPSKHQAEQCRKSKSCRNGQRYGSNHCKLYISGSTQTVSERTVKRIKQSVKNIVNKNKPYNKGFFLCQNSRIFYNQRCYCKNKSIPEYRQHKSYFIKLFKIKIC